MRQKLLDTVTDLEARRKADKQECDILKTPKGPRYRYVGYFPKS